MNRQLNRRQFLGAGLAAAAAAPTLWGQNAGAPDWGGPVLDVHFHLRPSQDSMIAHLDGCGVSNAVLLTGVNFAEQAKAMLAKYPGRFTWAVSANLAMPDAETLLTKAVKDGAHGLGEIKWHVEADGKELRRMYSLAADLQVPIMIHFQEVPHFEGEGVFSTGFKRFAAILKAFPKTTFIGHADAFWANLSADYADDVAYPNTPVKPGGVTDKLLADYPNLYGDLSANSGNNGLSRSPEFTAGFLARHQNKLLFGSDCSCADGKGGGVSQNNNPAAARLVGKCVARETLALLKKSSSAAVFRKLVWENGRKVYRFQS